MAERIWRFRASWSSWAGVKDAVWAGRRWPHLPLALLLLALLTLFLGGGGPRGYFYQPGHHDFLSVQSMTLAANLSPEDGFLMFRRHLLDAEGNRDYELYNRFPMGPYALIKLITLPLGDDFARQIYAARLLMLLCVAGAALLAYLSLCRLAGSRWIAVTATALAFSSGYVLYYGDMISSHIASLFAIMLVFHAMTVFEQEGRFRQLAVKSILALLLGWHIYALLFPFVVLGLAKEAAAALRCGKPGGGMYPPPALTPAALRLRLRLAEGWPRRAAAMLRGSRYFRLGLLTLAFGLLLLAFNLGNEYRAAGGETPLTKLPTVRSALYRSAINPLTPQLVAAQQEFGIPYWALFFREQFAAIGIMSVPFALPTYQSIANLDASWARSLHERQTFYTGIAMLGGAVLGLGFMRHRRLLAALLLAGFCWAVPLHGSSIIHDFESLFYIGIPLVGLMAGLRWVRSLSRERLLAALGCAAVLLFVFSGFQMTNRFNAADPAAVNAAQFQQEVMDDFRRIRPIAAGKGVLFLFGKKDELAASERGVFYYLAGSVLVFQDQRRHRNRVDFLVLGEREPGPALLTPDNRRVFLYDRAAYDTQQDNEASRLIGLAGAPAMRDPFEVYHHDNALVYLKDGCAPGDVEPAFMLHPIPADVSDLPEWTRARGFHNLDFAFDDHRVGGGGRCLALIRLPGYAVSAIRTGQFIIHPDGAFETLWEETFAVAAE